MNFNDSETQRLFPSPASNETFNIKKESRFKQCQYQDVWALILYLISLFGFVVISLYTIPYANQIVENAHGVGYSGVVGLLMAGSFSGILFSFAYLVLIQNYTGTMILWSFYCSIAIQFVLGTVLGISYLGNQEFSYLLACGLFFLSGTILIWAFHIWKARIPFATLMLKSVASITKMYPATLFTSVIGLLIQSFFGFYWLANVAGLAVMLNQKIIQESTALVIGAFSLFILFWSIQIINNSVHLTVAGLFASFYFLGVSQDGIVSITVRNPTYKSAKRAMTISLGSNCYGSILIALVQFLRALIQAARQSAQDDNNQACSLFLVCLECIVSCIEDILEYFNKYAFAQVAIYGKDYYTAAKDTWALAKSRGIDAIINDNLIGNVLGIGAFTVGLLGLLSGFIYSKLFFALGSDNLYAAASIFTFVLSIVEFNVLSTVIDSGVATTFVCLAEDPEALLATKPELYHQILETYPHTFFV